MKRLILLLVICAPLSVVMVQAQTLNYSAADALILQQKVADNPDIIGKYMIYEENMKQLIGSGISTANSKTDTLIGGKRIIPVVFHIVHMGGPENISKAQVEDAVALLNIDYNKLNTDTSAAYSWPAFASRRADCQIEFRLAKIGPNGECTDGIVRHYDPQTNYAYFTTMTDYAWEPSHYLNIFSVNFIYPEGMSLPDGAFIGGMSPFPPSNPLSQALTGGDSLADGVLIRHDGLGSIGTATTLGGMPINALNRTFTHETGHYFNLYHPFQNLMFGIIPASSGCPDLFAPNGDEVDDTPPVDVATQNMGLACYLPGSRNTCNQDSPDEPDMIENYMDYQWGYCTNIFTSGQYTRMQATLNGDRRSLWSFENLIATGVLDTNPPVCRPMADFYANTRFICAGGSIAFSEQSYGGIADTLVWTFSGGTPAASSDTAPVIQYNTAGTYEVKLMVANAFGADSLLKSAYIIVSDPALTDTTPMQEGFEAVNMSDWPVINDVGNAWELKSSVAYSGTKCIGLTNFSNNNAGSYDEIISPVYDFTTMPSGAIPLLKFRLAYSGKYIAGTIVSPADTAYDRLSIYQSVDCGVTWQQKYNRTGPALATITTLPDNFVPSSQSDWREEAVSLSYSSLNESDVRFKIVFYSNGANNIYIDDINITTPALGSPELLAAGMNLTVYPNPADESTTISFELLGDTKVKVEVYDVVGRIVCTPLDAAMHAGPQRCLISKSMLGGSGLYVIKMTVDGQIINRKLIIQ